MSKSKKRKKTIKLPRSYHQWCPSDECGKTLVFIGNNKKQPFKCTACGRRYTKDDLIAVWRKDNEKR